MASNFFIKRPIFSSCMAILITLAGAVTFQMLPMAEWPQVVPPTVVVQSTYYGANAEVVEKSVTTPLELAINGVDGMVYMSSVSTDSGDSIITITFEVGYDLDIAAVDVQNRVSTAKAELPDIVQRSGISISKQSPSVLLAVVLSSESKDVDSLYLSNYARLNLKDRLSRIPGVGSVEVVGAGAYAMRVWTHPEKMASLGITGADVVKAIGQQNIQAPMGQIGQAPTSQSQKLQYTVTTSGRLSTVSQFENIVLRIDDQGALVQLKDIATVELGSETYDQIALFKEKPAGIILLRSYPGANDLGIASAVSKLMDNWSPSLPAGMSYSIPYDTTIFVRDSFKEVLKTLLEAFILVSLIILLFLQKMRITIIPTLVVPVAIVGTFTALAVMGFTNNTLTLFGLVLAIGLVVDDAIVVVENVERHLHQGHITAKQASIKAMQEVSGPIVATTCVMLAVFVPVAFTPGTTGILSRQFALTIAASVSISAVLALSFSPALCGVLMRQGDAKTSGFFGLFNRVFDRFISLYTMGLKQILKHRFSVVCLYLLIVVGLAYLFENVPKSFLSPEDKGVFFVNIQTPDGTALDQTASLVKKIDAMVSDMPGIEDTVTIIGLDFLQGTSIANMGVVFANLKPWSQRTTPDLKLAALKHHAATTLADIQGADIAIFSLPPIMGLGTTGGFDLQVQDLNNGRFENMHQVVTSLISATHDNTDVDHVFSLFANEHPQLFLDIDRVRAQMLGVNVEDILMTLQTTFGAFYVNQFNKFGRVYRVFVQGVDDSRTSIANIDQLYVRNKNGQMLPISSFVKVEPTVGPQIITHYNLYRSAEINGDAAIGKSSDDAMTSMESLLKKVLPKGFAYEWTATSYQEIKAGNVGPIILLLSLICAYLVLAMQYESWIYPLIILLTVPLAMFGALGLQWLRGLENDIYCQVGLIMLVGLASKNAILIVEFAKKRIDAGETPMDAALEAVNIRLRPVLMTASALILALLPLVFASGAGAAAQQSLGTAVLGGVLFSTLLSLIILPVFIVIFGGVSRHSKEP